MKKMNSKAWWTLLNNKDGKEYNYYTWEIDKLWHDPYPESFAEYNFPVDEYEAMLAEFEDEEEKKEYIENCKNCNIYTDEKEYLIALVENEVWTSPRGIESVWKVVNIDD